MSPALDLKEIEYELDQVIGHLATWADTAEERMKSLTDVEAAPWKHMRDNYRNLQQRLTKIADKLTGSGGGES